MVFIGADIPEHVSRGSVDICADCGSVTIAGIYDYRNPDKVYFVNDGDPHFDIELREFDDEE